MLDTNVVVSALLWNGNPRRLLRFGRGEGIRFFSSAPLLSELTEVLVRPKFEKKIAASLLSIENVVDLYAELIALCGPLQYPALRPILTTML